MDQKDFFNEMAEQWDEVTKHNLIKAELLVGLLGIKQGDTVLDVGTGTGVLLPILMSLTDSANITAIDVAEKMVEVAKRKFAHTQVTFLADDALVYPFGDKRFDFIVCYSMFPHFPDKAKAIRGLSALLAEGGRLAVIHSNSRDEINAHHSKCDDAVKEDKLPRATVMMDMMTHCGLREEILIDNEEMYLVCARNM